jgi:hypothetical protein
VVKQATFAEAGAAIITIELVAVSNVIPAFTAFYGSIDKLKHQSFVFGAGDVKMRERATCAVQRFRLARFD